MTDNGTLSFDVSTSTTVQGAIGGTGAVIQAGSGTTFFRGASTYSGSTTIDSGGTLQISSTDSGSTTIDSGGTLQISAQFGVPLNGPVTDNGTLSVDALSSNGSVEVSGISGSGALIKAGQSTLTLTGNDTYSGTTTISAGTLQAGSTNLFGGGTVGLSSNSDVIIDSAGTLDLIGCNPTIGALSGSGSVVNSGSAAILTVGATNDSGTFSGTIGSGSKIALVKTGTGTETLAGANSYSGGTTVSEGILQLGAAGNPLGTGGTTVDSGAALDLNGFSQGGTLTLNGTGISGGGALLNSSTTAATYGGPITLGSNSSIVASGGDINLTYSTTGSGSNNNDNNGPTLTLGGSANGTLITGMIPAGTLIVGGTGIWTLTGSNPNAYFGPATINSGATLQIGNGGALGEITDNGTLSFDTSGFTTFSSAISGSGALVQAGSGTVALTGTNTYSGATTISAGEIQAVTSGNDGPFGSGTSSLSSNSDVFIGSAGTLDLNGINSTIGALSGTGSVINSASSGLSSLTVGATNDSGTFSGGARRLRFFPRLLSCQDRHRHGNACRNR